MRIHKLPPTAEAGFALPAAMIVLLVVALLAGAAISVSTQTSTSTTRSINVEAALEAAEAGVQVATYRLSQIKPGETQCINEKEAVTSGCNNNGESLGNGKTFKYWTTLPLKTGERCAGQTVATKAASTQRCVTAEGKVNSVTQRLSALVESAVWGIAVPRKGHRGPHGSEGERECERPCGGRQQRKDRRGRRRQLRTGL